MIKLKKGDIIGVFSPSSPVTVFARDRYERGKAYLENKGFKILDGSLMGKSDFYRSGSIEERANELNELIRNPSVRCIISSIGGMNSNSILPYIDYETLRKDPKIIIGYSDVTAILMAIYEKTGIKTYYGPALAASFGEFPPLVDETYEYFNDICISPKLPYEIDNPKAWSDEYIDWNNQTRAKKTLKNHLITVKAGVAEGRLIAGNLNTMEGIWGTEYMPKIRKGDILLIEDSMKDISEIERSFSLLKLSGVFEKIGGLILGKHELFKDLGSRRRPHEVLLEIIGDYDFPFLADYDCCHTHPMITVPIGGKVRLDSEKQKIKILEI